MKDDRNEGVSHTFCVLKEQKKRRMPVYTGILCKVQPCLLEVPLQQALEGFAVAGFVAGHFIVGLRPTGC